MTTWGGDRGAGEDRRRVAGKMEAAGCLAPWGGYAERGISDGGGIGVWQSNAIIQSSSTTRRRDGLRLPTEFNWLLWIEADWMSSPPYQFEDRVTHSHWATGVSNTRTYKFTMIRRRKQERWTNTRARFSFSMIYHFDLISESCKKYNKLNTIVKWQTKFCWTLHNQIYTMNTKINVVQNIYCKCWSRVYCN